MSDIPRLIDSLDAAHLGSGSLHQVPFLDEFRAFLASPLFAQKMARFEDSTFNPEETAGLYEDNVVVFVVKGERWSINLVRHGSIARAIYALPFPSLIGPVGEADWCELEIYDYPRGIDRDVSQAVGAYARLVRTVRLERGEYWSTSPSEPAYCLVAQSPGTTFLRVTGPLLGPYSHSFSRGSLAYSHSGFAAPEVTALDIYSHLAKCAAEAGHFDGFPPQDRLSVAGALVRCMTDAAAAPVSEWNFVQALHAVDPEGALSVIRDLASRPGPLAAVALGTLNHPSDAASENA